MADFNVNPYYDDYDEDKNFHRVLFKPGSAVQARELTQLQTIMQKQAERHGSFTFKHGSPVVGGGISFDTMAKSLKLNTSFTGNAASTFANVSVVGQTSGANGRVVITTESSGGDPATIYLRLTSSTDFANNEQLKALGGTVVLANTGVSSAQGNCFLAGVEAGTYYINGNFVKNTKQQIVVDKTNWRTNAKIGFAISETFIDSNSDATLTDPAQGSYNYAAPGADRYKINLTFMSTALTANTANFVDLLTVDDGAITKWIQYPVLSVLGETMARRTYDESGSYTVRYYPIHYRDNISGNTEQISVAVEPGKAFVQGFEHVSHNTRYYDADKARSTKNKNNNQTYAQYGNYTIVNNVSGEFDITSHEEVDLHNVANANTILLINNTGIFTAGEQVTGNTSSANSVVDFWVPESKILSLTPNTGLMVAGEVITGLSSGANGQISTITAGIDSSTPSNYANTKMGTAKIRQFMYEDGSAGGPYEYRAYLYDLNYTGSSDFTVVRGLHAGAWNDTFPGLADIDTDAGWNDSNQAYLYETSLNSLVFNLPNAAIKTVRDQSSAVDTNYQLRRNFTTVQFTSGVATINTADASETFFGSGALSAANKRTYYHVVAEETVGPFTKGDVIPMDTAGRTITVATTQATFDINNAISIQCSIIASITDAVAGEKTKTLNTNQVYVITNPNTSSTATETIPVSDIYKLKGVYTGANTTFTPVPPVLTLGTVTGTFTQGEIITGSTSNANGDVILWTSGNSTLEYVTNYGTFANSEVVLGATSGANGTITSLDVGNTNLANSYTLNTGQKDNYYDHGSITLNYGATAPTGQIKVVYDNFSHTGSGYFSVDSYTGSGVIYADIPTFTSPTTRKIVELRDVLDFRPRRTDANTVMEGIQLPEPNLSISSDYDYYVPRLDTLFVDKDGNHGIVTGIPDERPIPPVVNEEGLLALYNIEMPAYTFKLSDIKTRFIDTNRYTMRDIGDIARRVDRLEYYTGLSLLEKNAADFSIKDSSGANRFKNGILVDAFTGHNIGDVRDTDYKTSIDPLGQVAGPPFISRNFDFDYDAGSSTGIQLTGHILSLPYSEEIFISQLKASKTLNINPFNVINWVGILLIEPPSDEWVDTSTRPDVLVNFEGNNDAWEHIASVITPENAPGFGTQWNDWEVIGTGSRVISSSTSAFPEQQYSPMGSWNTGRIINVTSSTAEQFENQQRTGSTFRLAPTMLTRSIGDRIVDVSIIPFIRPRTLTITATGMKPSTRVYAFFDSIDVGAHVTPAGGSLGDNLITDVAGSLTCTFAIPNSDTLRFRTGERSFRLIDDALNVGGNSSTIAEANYSAQGLLQTQENVSISVRDFLSIPGQATENREVITGTTSGRSARVMCGTCGPRGRGFYPSYNGLNQVGVADPIAETFFVDRALYSEGVFITSIDIYFATKSSTVPVMMHIRPTVNGFPSATTVLPFGFVTKQPDDITTSADGSVATKFTFDAPIYLTPGVEYSFALLTNTLEYEVYESVIGSVDILTSEMISSQPFTGSLFKSQNSSTWTPEQTEDMKFVINKANFTRTGTHEAILKSAAATSNTNMDLVHPTIQDFQPMSSRINYAHKATSTASGSLDASYTNIPGDANYFFDEQHQVKSTGTGTYVNRASFVSLHSDISPLIDTQRMSFIGVENVVNNDNTGETGTSGGAATARYITRPVSLADGFDATDLNVVLRAHKIFTSDIEVYYKVLSLYDDDLLENKNWVQMYEVSEASNDVSARDEFIEIQYKSSSTMIPSITYTSSGTTFSSFKYFQIKVVFLSTNTAFPPRIGDLRVVALA
jgi:hypothetical protein